MNPTQDVGEPQFTSHQTRRLEKRFASLVTEQGGDPRTITKGAFCSQPEVSTNVFVGAYIDKLLLAPDKNHGTASGHSIGGGSSEDSGEHERDSGAITPGHNRAGLTYELFVHTFWVFSAWGSRAEKEKVVETLLEPDENGWIDRPSMLRFVRYMLPSAPHQGLEAVVDDLTRCAFQQDRKAKGGDMESGGSTSTGVFIGKLLSSSDFVDRLTIHM